jgi:hypothetical protein
MKGPPSRAQRGFAHLQRGRCYNQPARAKKICSALSALALAALSSRAAVADVATRAIDSKRTFQVPGLSASALQFALREYHRLMAIKVIDRPRLTVIDYSLPSTEKRLLVLDPVSGEVLFAERVAHGKGSGELVATAFGNTPESHLSSLGVFRTAETYQGAHGYSLRIDGLDKDVNDRAREREIVFHSASYVTEAFAKKHGRLGRSYGCPALDPNVSREIIDAIRGGSLVVALNSTPSTKKR